MRDDIPHTLPSFMYFLVSPNYLNITCHQKRLVKLKPPIECTNDSVWGIRFSTGELQGTQPINVLPNRRANKEVSSEAVPGLLKTLIRQGWR